MMSTVETGCMSIAYGVFWRFFCDSNRFHYPLEIIGFYLVRLDVLNVRTGILPERTGKNEQSIIMRKNYSAGCSLILDVHTLKTISCRPKNHWAQESRNVYYPPFSRNKPEA